MPNLDKTGPAGKGPKTGRGLGNCDGAKRPCFRLFRRGRGKGLGLGRRPGRRFRNR